MKVRIYQLARDLRISSDALVSMIAALGGDVKSHMSSVEDDIVAKIKAKIAAEKEIVRGEIDRKAQIHVDIQRTKDKEEAARRKPAPAVTPVAAVAPEPVLQPPPPTPVVVRPPMPVQPAQPTPWRPQLPVNRKTGRKGKKGRTAVDERLVRDNVRKTLALDPGRRKHRRRRADGPGGGPDTAEESTSIKVTEYMTVAELASVMEVNPAEVVGTCLQLGIIANINRRLDKDEMTLVADEYRLRAGVRERIRRGGPRRGDRRARGEVRIRAPAPGRDRHGSRRSRKDEPPRLHSQDARRRGGVGRDHAAHRRLLREGDGRTGHVPRHSGSRGVHRDARARRPGDGHRRARGCR